MLQLLHAPSIPSRSPVTFQLGKLICHLLIEILEAGQGRTADHRIEGRTGPKLHLATHGHLHASIYLSKDLPCLHDHAVGHGESAERGGEVDAQELGSSPTVDHLLVTNSITSLGDKGDTGYLSVVGDQSFRLLDVCGGRRLRCVGKRQEVLRNRGSEGTAMHVPAL